MAKANQEIRVLVADDDKIVRLHINSILTKNGFTQIMEATDGNEALTQLRTFKPDITLLDIYMPHMNGWEVVHQMKKDNPNNIIIMLTSSKAEKDVMAAFEHGVQGYLYKPASPVLLIDTIQKLVNETAAYEKVFPLPLRANSI